MTEIGTVERIFPANRAAVARRLLFGSALLFIYSLLMVDLLPEFLALTITIPSFAFAYLSVPLFRMLVTGEATVMTDRGILDHTGGLEFVAWNELRSANIRSYFGSDFIELELRDPEPVLQRLAPVSRMVMRQYVKSFDGRLSLNASLVRDGSESLHDVILGRIASARAAA
jgi:hypothetical protein